MANAKRPRKRDGNQSMINPNNIPAATAARRSHSALYHLLLQLANLFLRYTLLHKVKSLCQHTNKELNPKTRPFKNIAID